MRKLEDTCGSRLPLAAAVLVVAATVGCHESDGPRLAPTAGQVTYQGKPVAGAFVTFRADGAARFSSGTTDADGNYSLSTYEPGDGALLGKNLVTVTAASDADAAVSREEFAKRKASARASQQRVIPARFSDPKTSDLSVTVVEGANNHDFDLTP